MPKAYIGEPVTQRARRSPDSQASLLRQKTTFIWAPFPEQRAHIPYRCDPDHCSIATVTQVTNRAEPSGHVPLHERQNAMMRYRIHEGKRRWRSD